jgi:hypothetical protein
MLHGAYLHFWTSQIVSRRTLPASRSSSRSIWRCGNCMQALALTWWQLTDTEGRSSLSRPCLSWLSPSETTWVCVTAQTRQAPMANPHSMHEPALNARKCRQQSARPRGTTARRKIMHYRERSRGVLWARQCLSHPALQRLCLSPSSRHRGGLRFDTTGPLRNVSSRLTSTH